MGHDEPFLPKMLSKRHSKIWKRQRVRHWPSPHYLKLEVTEPQSLVFANNFGHMTSWKEIQAGGGKVVQYQELLSLANWYVSHLLGRSRVPVPGPVYRLQICNSSNVPFICISGKSIFWQNCCTLSKTLSMFFVEGCNWHYLYR
jgi:hypothetical protein